MSREPLLQDYRRFTESEAPVPGVGRRSTRRVEFAGDTDGDWQSWASAPRSKSSRKRTDNRTEEQKAAAKQLTMQEVAAKDPTFAAVFKLLANPRNNPDQAQFNYAKGDETAGKLLDAMDSIYPTFGDGQGRTDLLPPKEVSARHQLWLRMKSTIQRIGNALSRQSVADPNARGVGRGLVADLPGRFGGRDKAERAKRALHLHPGSDKRVGMSYFQPPRQYRQAGTADGIARYGATFNSATKEQMTNRVMDNMHGYGEYDTKSDLMSAISRGSNPFSIATAREALTMSKRRPKGILRGQGGFIEDLGGYAGSAASSFIGKRFPKVQKYTDQYLPAVGRAIGKTTEQMFGLGGYRTGDDCDDAPSRPMKLARPEFAANLNPGSYNSKALAQFQSGLNGQDTTNVTMVHKEMVSGIVPRETGFHRVLSVLIQPGMNGLSQLKQMAQSFSEYQFLQLSANVLTTLSSHSANAQGTYIVIWRADPSAPAMYSMAEAFAEEGSNVVHVVTESSVTPAECNPDKVAGNSSRLRIRSTALPQGARARDYDFGRFDVYCENCVPGVQIGSLVIDYSCLLDRHTSQGSHPLGLGEGLTVALSGIQQPAADNATQVNISAPVPLWWAVTFPFGVHSSKYLATPDFTSTTKINLGKKPDDWSLNLLRGSDTNGAGFHSEPTYVTDTGPMNTYYPRYVNHYNIREGLRATTSYPVKGIINPAVACSKFDLIVPNCAGGTGIDIVFTALVQNNSGGAIATPAKGASVAMMHVSAAPGITMSQSTVEVTLQYVPAGGIVANAVFEIVGRAHLTTNPSGGTLVCSALLEPTASTGLSGFMNFLCLGSTFSVVRNDDPSRPADLILGLDI